MEDKMIVDLYWQRDEGAIAATAKKYGAYLRSIAFNILSDIMDAEECVNDTYVGAWTSMPDKRPEKLLPYLGKLTRWLALNRLDGRRSLKRGGGETALCLDELSEIPDSCSDPEQRIEYNELCKAINRFLSMLRPVERQVFLARYWFVTPVSEIADKFGFSASKVKSMLMRTRNKLKKYLEEEALC